MKFDYYMYMAEAENCFPDERKQAIAECIRDFRVIKEDGYDPNEYITQVLAIHNLKECQLTDSEIEYINNAVNED